MFGMSAWFLDSTWPRVGLVAGLPGKLCDSVAFQCVLSNVFCRVRSCTRAVVYAWYMAFDQLLRPSIAAMSYLRIRLRACTITVTPQQPSRQCLVPSGLLPGLLTHLPGPSAHLLDSQPHLQLLPLAFPCLKSVHVVFKATLSTLGNAVGYYCHRYACTQIVT